MEMRKIFVALIFIFSCFFYSNVIADSYSAVSFGYTKHIAKDPHDAQLGYSYYSDPEENGFAIGYVFGNKSDELMLETEINYYPEVSNTIASGIDANVSTLSLMENILFAPNFGDSSYGIFGGGIGIARTNVDINYNKSSVTFNGADDEVNLAYQLIAGYGINNIEFLFKYSDFGEVQGGTGTASNSATYYADKFDNIYQSVVVRFKF